ncbi:MAG: hypothetical protein HY747_03460 [Elusimicrobia bacterium]|nr:hypothetical protein [Elusimicrobiota bacterium]
MSIFDGIIVAIAALGLVFWVRGCFKAARADCIAALIIAAFACGIYFYLFSATNVAYLGSGIFAVFLLALLPFVRLLRMPLGRLLMGVCVALALAAGALEHKLVSAGNALLVIEPYRTGKGWAFDEPRLGLHGEPSRFAELRGRRYGQ